MSDQARALPAPPAPPATGHDEGLFQARALRVILPAALVATLCGLAVTLHYGVEIASSTLATASAPMFAAIWLARRGRLRSAALVLLADLLVMAASLLSSGVGLEDVALLVHLATIVAAGLLLDRRSFRIFTGVALLSLAGIIWLQSAGRLAPWPDARAPEMLATAILAAIVMVATAIAMDVLIAALHGSLREARRNQRALQATEAKFTKAFHANPSAMLIARLSDGVVLDLNDAFAKATGQAREDLLGRTTHDFGVLESEDHGQEIYEALRERGSVEQAGVRFPRRPGEAGAALLSGEVVEIEGEACALLCLSDITDRRRAEEALAESEERYRLISKVTSDYTFSSRIGPGGEMRQEWVAGAFEKITGYSPEEALAEGGWRARLHPDDVGRDDAALAELAANRPAVADVRMIARDGTVRWVRVYAHPVWSATENRLVQIYGAVRDITANRMADAEREALIRELEAKNAELERFTYTVSHDLQSPLITIGGFLGHVEEAVSSGDAGAARADIARIRQAANRMQRLLKELLDMSRIGRAMSLPEEVRLDALGREAASLARGRRSGQEVRFEIQNDMPPVLGDRSRLLEMVQNLVDNAVKFMGTQPRPRVTIGARPSDDGPVFFVRDNGIGVEPRFRQRVFDLFDKLDPVSEGTGIGLALAKRIVELHGGRIWLESEGSGRGSTFCFTLPAAGHGGSARAP